MELYGKVGELTRERKPFAIATVVRIAGSSSAKPGSKAIIDARGKIVLGWVGGGCAESAVRTEALKCIEQEKPQLITLDMTDELGGVGMPCGGIMDVYIEPVLPKPELLIVGHGRIAETLAELGHIMNFSVAVNDPGADRESFPHADRLIADDLDLTATPIGAQTFIVVATQHKGDHLWLQKALESDAAYVALIASRHRAKLVLDYVRSAGVRPEKLEGVWAPAGLDLGAVTPEEIALSIISQMVAQLRRGSARPLKQKGADESALEAAAPAGKVISQCEADDPL